MKTKKIILTTLKYVGIVAITMIFTCAATVRYMGGSELWLRYLIKRYYVEDVDTKVLNEGAKAGMVAALDDEHSVYISSEYGFDNFEGSVSGEYSGIGASIQQINKKAVISEVHPNTPAQKAGLLPGDIIIEAAGVASSGSTLNEVSQRLQGEAGTSVNIKIERDGVQMEFDIVRESISLEAVSWEMLDDNIGYIKLTSFDVDADKEFIKALEGLKDAKGLIVDLRNNPGGYMDVAINTVDLFIDEGVITTAKYKSSEETHSATDNNQTSLSDNFLLKTPICILVNQNSASASEIFSAALKDHKRATIVGTNTYGKGSIQTTFPFEDNSGVKLTVGHFYSPNGTKIDKVGIAPHTEVELPEEINELGNIPREQDLQLHAAIDALK